MEWYAGKEGAGGGWEGTHRVHCRSMKTINPRIPEWEGVQERYTRAPEPRASPDAPQILISC